MDVKVAAAAAAILLGPIQGAGAQGSVKIGLIVPLTGAFSAIGQEIQFGARVFVQHHGTSVGGKTIELIIKDDGGVPDTAKRIAQELIVNTKINVLTGVGMTPLALTMAPLATEAKIPMVVMGAGTSIITTVSPFIARTSFTATQVTYVAGDYFAKNIAKTAVTLVSDFAAGIDYETGFKKAYEAAGGRVIASLRAPLMNVDFAPYLQRAADAKPESLFIFVPAGQGATLMRQFAERGLDKSNIKFLATGDIMDEQLIDQIGDVALGNISGFHYSDVHPSALNKKFTSDFEKLAIGMRANFMGVGGYDGMALIYKALEKTGGDAEGTKLIEAMKGMAWESPRGPISIDPNTREIVQNVYLRKVERMGGRLVNVEFATYPNVKDPAKN
jgi:branched-chain amino acid transport system substrate-binding protein